jgi:hypothetical protein
VSLRFRRTVKLAPGVRLNLSKSGLGPPPVDLILDGDGTVHLMDETGTRLSPATVRRVRAQHDAEIRGWLAKWCEERNRLSGRILNLHLETPGPETPLEFDARPFEEPAPEPFIPHVPSLRDRSWPPARKKIEEENAAGQQRYEEELWEWRRRKSAHEAAEVQRRKALEIGRFGDRVVMEGFLARQLEKMSWPAETAVAFEISLDATVVFLDVDLPEIEMIPDHEAAVAARGLRIRYNELSDAQLRRAYAWHIHGVRFRLIGEVFVALPGIERVVASGYPPRPDPATGRITDDYLISAEVEREIWTKIDFVRLDAIDLPAAFERFQLRRRMTRHGVFTAIEPFGAATAGGLFG